MRLFVALWPPGDVLEELAALARPGRPALRWVGPDQFHVTMAFLGEVGDADVAAVGQALGRAATRAAPAPAVAGPATVLLGPSVLAVPVTGVDDLAAQVALEVGPWLGAEGPRPFQGHVTLARAPRRAEIPPSLAGAAVATSWVARTVSLVRSTPVEGGVLYEDLDVVRLTGPRPPGAAVPSATANVCSSIVDLPGPSPGADDTPLP